MSTFPQKNELQEDYIKRYMSSSEAKSSFPDNKQRLAVAYSEFRKNSGKKECSMPFLEIKENDSGDLIVKGYIATTHLDSGFFDKEREVYVRDRITRDTLETWAKEINDGNPRANKVSVNHKREVHVAGVGLKGSARVDQFTDGEYGLYVDTLVDKTRADYSEIKYRVEKGLLDSYSIEFTTKDPMTEVPIPGAIQEYSVGEGMIRELMPSTKLQGWTIASQPMNEFAVMVKENFTKFMEEKRMTQEEMEQMEEVSEDPAEDDTQSATDPKKKVAKKGVKPAQMNESSGVGSGTHNAFYGAPKKSPLGYSTGAGKEMSEEDANGFAEYKETKRKEEMFSIAKEAIKGSIKEALSGLKVENKVSAGNENIEKKEVVEFKEMLKSPGTYGLKEMASIAANFANANGHRYTKSVEDRTSSGGFKVRYTGKEAGRSNLLEFKSLGVVTNQNANTAYLMSAAELADSFDPIIYNALNQQTVTWNILNKDDFSNKGNNQVQFVLKTAANTTASFYTGNAISTGNVTRLKLETKFKKCQVGVEVDGDMIAAARGGPIGDVFAQEVMDSTIDLLSVMNQAFFSITGNAAGTGAPGAETDAMPISFLYLANSGTYTTLYNLTRSAANKLSPTTATDTYINQASARISLTNLRAAKRQALKDGSMIQNLVFVCNHTQADLYRGIYDAIQRTTPTTSAFGMSGRPSFDTIPIFEDKDCITTDWWLLDLDSLRIAIWVPPTLEMLGKDADSQKGFIKTYYAVYCRNPRRFVNIYGCATS